MKRLRRYRIYNVYSHLSLRNNIPKIINTYEFRGKLDLCCRRVNWFYLFLIRTLAKYLLIN